MSQLDRRDFVTALGATAVSSVLARDVLAKPKPLLYPPEDLSYFDRPIKPAPPVIKLGYAAITWGGNDLQAIKDISEVGFPGVQLRTSILQDYGRQPRALRELLDQYRLEFVAFSSGGVNINSAEAEEIAKHIRHAEFVRDAGGLYLQLTDSSRPRGRQPSRDDFKRLGRLMTEIGKRAIDIGVPVGYHNHMNSLGEAPDEVDRVLEAADPRYLKFEIDVAHFAQGGGDPVKAIRRYRDRLLFLHIKDVESPVPDDPSKTYRFVELGRGRVDLASVFSALKDIRFSGWAVVELDSVPDKSRTPKDCAIINKRYLEETLKLKV